MGFSVEDSAPPIAFTQSQQMVNRYKYPSGKIRTMPFLRFALARLGCKKQSDMFFRVVVDLTIGNYVF